MRGVRYATPDDAEALGRIHIAAWQVAYRGQIPDEYLRGLKVSDRVDLWRRALEAGIEPGEAAFEQGKRTALVIEDEHASIAGFAALGPTSEPAEPGVGEVRALYVDPELWGRGFGRDLLAAATDELRASGHDRGLLWVLKTNERARRFYESLG